MNSLSPIYALVFPGQGSQYVSMGYDLWEAYPEARAIFDEADEILGFPLAKLCFVGPKEALNDTLNAQPAILTMSVAALRVLEARNRLEPSFVAGHSLGEYTALVAAAALDFVDALLLVRERGRLMKEAGQQYPGAMAAVIGLDDGTVEEICREASKRVDSAGVVVANFNSPGQVVISGGREALEVAVELARARGARRVIPLAVSVAGHSPLLREAARGLERSLESVPFRPAAVPVVANVTAQPVTEPQEIKDGLVRQLYQPVQWVRSVELMIAQGVSRFVEIGPKNVLAGLIRRINRGVQVVNVGDVAGIEAFANVSVRLRLLNTREGGEG
jgi:[acyl-carrier-protein] S-malonyltransferase